MYMAQRSTAVGVLGAVYSGGLPVCYTLLCNRTILAQVQVSTDVTIRLGQRPGVAS